MTKRLPVTEWRAIPDTCTCDTCKDMCKIPCWPTPEEAVKLMELGYGDRLMLVSHFLTTNGYKFFNVLAPAKRTLEGKEDIYEFEHGCNFHTDEGLCELHTVCKPIEGRLAICKDKPGRQEPLDLRDRVGELWDNVLAQRIVDRWIKEYAKGDQKRWELLDGAWFYDDGED